MFNQSLRERLPGRVLLQDSQAQRLQAFYPRRSDRLDTRSPEYKCLPLRQRAAYSYVYPGFRFAPPWALDFRYAFGVFSSAPPNNDSTVIYRFFTLNTCPKQLATVRLMSAHA